MNSAVNCVCGRLYMSSGVPCCSILPKLSNRILSDIAIASVWSCVTTNAERPSRTINSRNHARASSRSFASRLDKGSSISTTGGVYTRARGDADPRLLSAGELVRQPLRQRTKAQIGKRLIDALLDLAHRNAAQAQ